MRRSERDRTASGWRWSRSTATNPTSSTAPPKGWRWLDEIGHSHLGLLLDTFHMNIEEPTYAGSIEQVMAAGQLWHIHLGDSNRLPPGQGHIPFGDIIAALRKSGYDGYLSAELFPRPDPDARPPRRRRTCVPS